MSQLFKMLNKHSGFFRTTNILRWVCNNTIKLDADERIQQIHGSAQKKKKDNKRPVKHAHTRIETKKNLFTLTHMHATHTKLSLFDLMILRQ